MSLLATAAFGEGIDRILIGSPTRRDPLQIYRDNSVVARSLAEVGLPGKRRSTIPFLRVEEDTEMTMDEALADIDRLNRVGANRHSVSRGEVTCADTQQAVRL